MNLVYGVRFTVYGKKNQKELFGMKQKKIEEANPAFQGIVFTVYRLP